VKLAIVGSGVAGLVAARRLHSRHDVTVYEAEAHVGGHTRTVPVEIDGAEHAVDMGFIVYNEKTYPHFCALLAGLGVETQPTDMSFGVRSERSGLEWASHGIGGLLAQPGNLLRPSFRRMLRDVLRFNRESRRLLSTRGEKATLGDYLAGGGYSEDFVAHYVVPMGAAIWSADPAAFLSMPASTFVRFFENHGLLEAPPSVAWRVVRGGSARYVEKLVAPFRDRIHTRCPVRGIRRGREGVDLELADGTRRFDQVILAVHSDQALALLRDPSEAERRVLGAIRYQENEVALHTDASLLPRRRRARASWNYLVPRDGRGRALVTYDMNRLQGIASSRPLLVTLNGADRIDPGRVLHRFVTGHPVLDASAVAGQRLRPAIDGRRNTWFCGAWWGYGFHEDAVKSALGVCARLDPEA
jgi:predicted NAD/FAD-binding protein